MAQKRFFNQLVINFSGEDPDFNCGSQPVINTNKKELSGVIGDDYVLINSQPITNEDAMNLYGRHIAYHNHKSEKIDYRKTITPKKGKYKGVQLKVEKIEKLYNIYSPMLHQSNQFPVNISRMPTDPYSQYLRNN